jgi:hypothetical protein
MRERHGLSSGLEKAENGLQACKSRAQKKECGEEKRLLASPTSSEDGQHLLALGPGVRFLMRLRDQS